MPEPAYDYRQLRFISEKQSNVEVEQSQVAYGKGPDTSIHKKLETQSIRLKF